MRLKTQQPQVEIVTSQHTVRFILYRAWHPYGPLVFQTNLTPAEMKEHMEVKEPFLLFALTDQQIPMAITLSLHDEQWAITFWEFAGYGAGVVAATVFAADKDLTEALEA